MPEITITLNQILAKRHCKDGLNRLLKVLGKPEGYVGDDVEFPMSKILDSNVLDDAIWAMRCRPEYAQLWRKFALWCGSKETQEGHEAHGALLSARFACGRLSTSRQVIAEKERQEAKLRQILTAGEWVE